VTDAFRDVWRACWTGSRLMRSTQCGFIKDSCCVEKPRALPPVAFIVVGDESYAFYVRIRGTSVYIRDA